MKTTLIILLCSFLFAEQTEISLKPDQSEMQVLGTSSIHDWESDVKDFSIKGILVGDDQIKNLRVDVKAISLKSGKSIMDDKTYDALKTDDHPVIRFSADQLFITGKKVKGKGKLSLSGQTRDIEVEADVVDKAPGQLKIQGAVQLNMTEFGVKPPSAMFGSITTGDVVTIKYDLLLSN